ncbi:MAG: hypothetical protein BRC31_01160 [Actinobacteria bacterium QS_5_72_10]|nr:MAG: hypothetical protein BRC32_07740 [Actinobacteria bacterium QS_8_72_14]PSO55045.1 MAG: hypothetical protein BRC31_01160 [Actinobacteria bacterium QS_5_72_10]
MAIDRALAARQRQGWWASRPVHDDAIGAFGGSHRQEAGHTVAMIGFDVRMVQARVCGKWADA